MRRLTVFNAMSLDGFIADSTGDMSWAHRQDHAIERKAQFPRWGVEFVR